MVRETINNDYFEWLSDLVCGKRSPQQVSFRKLLAYLHSVEFRYCIEKDANRAGDGIDLRYRYSQHINDRTAELYLEGPCSVLEMMVALAIRCEEQIMDDPGKGNRTGQWFWGMIVSLGLGSMYDARFNKRYVKDVLIRFLNREYEPDGSGGLFTIRRCPYDLRDVEIWYQLCWYLDSIV